MLDLAELKEYSNWAGRTALEIRLAAIAWGGWAKVFPKGSEPFPMWASRVRNYFNEKPKIWKKLSSVKAARTVNSLVSDDAGFTPKG